MIQEIASSWKDGLMSELEGRYQGRGRQLSLMKSTGLAMLDC